MDEFQKVNLRLIDEATGVALNRFQNIIRLESDPDDPPKPLEESRQGWRNIPQMVDVTDWLAWNPSGADVTGMAELEIWNTPDNQHLATFGIYVHPGCRRQGLGSRLLEALSAEVLRLNRRLMMTVTNDNVPAGVAFIQHYGLQPGMAARENQLRLDQLDPLLLQRWLDVPAETRRRFSLGFWDGPYPEARIQQVVELFHATNDDPHDQLEIEDRQFTPEMLRQAEQYQFARGRQRWTYVVVENLTEGLCGLTETFWNPNRPSIINQEFTGVRPEFRGLGLGKWLKAAMLDKILRERPQAKLVRTGNANSNAPMLAINDALGFKPYKSTTFWQIETEKLRQSLLNL